jgi:hypothetical protein
MKKKKNEKFNKIISKKNKLKYFNKFKNISKSKKL